MDDKKTKQTKKPLNLKTETKSETFLRLAKSRTEKVLKSLKILSNCSNKANYEYSQEQISKIFDSIYKSVEIALNKFSQQLPEAIKFEF